MNTPLPEITVSAQGLSRRYGTRTAVDTLTLELKRGEILGFLGPNGAGKTTTMQMLTGNLAPSAGSVRICGIDLIEQPVPAKARIGYLPEIPPLYRELTVQEYLDLAARLHRVTKTERPAAVKRAVERCGLAEVSRRLIGALSKGYQQRVGIAQAIVHSPDVVILDEPTVGLDPNQIRDIRSLIRELGQQHSVILSTHILPEVESVCDRVQILHHGKSVFSDNISALGKFHGGRVLLLGLRQPPEIAILRSIAGVVSVEALADHLFRISFEDGADPTEALTRRAATDGWGITQVTPGQSNLEDVFVQLTKEESA
jgi:ABC-2 type transport system ATP-binding protein